MDDFVQAGERVADRYTLEERIGGGGMAVVYAARDERTGRPVAVKFLRPDLSASLGVERFKREVGVAASLSHPHIVPLYDSGESNGRLFYVMPLVQGATLRAALAEEGAFSPQRALSVISDVGEALAYAHGRGLVHRDIKPSNILLTEDHAVVTDFGVATALDEADPTLTTRGAMIGTPGYMAPEQAEGDAGVDARADVYALGCVAYELLSGEPPFRSRSARGRLVYQLTGNVPTLSNVKPDIPRFVSDAVRRAMSTDRSDRFETVTEFVEVLKEGPSPRARPVDTPWPHRRRSTVRRAAVGSALAAVAVVGTVVVLRRPRPNPWPNGRPPSVVVIPMESQGASEVERTVAVDVAEDVTSELDFWEGVRPVRSVSLTGPMFDLGIRGPTVERLEDALRVARSLGVAALLTVTAEVRGDDARVYATTFDARAGAGPAPDAPVGRTIEVSGSTSNTLVLAEPIARRLLGLDDQPFTSLAAQRQRSRNPDALIEEEQGRRHLERWRLAEAEQRFRNAIALDSTFSWAHHRLAQTLYWRLVDGGTTSANVRRDIAVSSAAADRLSTGLSATDRAHVEAFRRFQEGDFEGARRIYNTVLESDSTDVYAWLLLGYVEFMDTWLVDTPDGLRPRGSWNVALEAFRRAVTLQPEFELGYGHILEVHRVVAGQADGSPSCRGFRLPGGPNVPPWQPPTPRGLAPICVARLDSIVWVPYEERASIDRAAMREGAAELLDEAVATLERWAVYASDVPTPVERLVSVFLGERRVSGPTSPERLRDLAARALSRHVDALALSSDTVASDLWLLADLHLATGGYDEAIGAAEEGLRLHAAAAPDEPLPDEAVNAFLATGNISRALSLFTRPRRVDYPVVDPSTRRSVPLGDAEPAVYRVSMLGASMVTGAPVLDEIAAIADAWSGTDYTEEDRAALRRNTAVWPRVATALAFDDAAFRAWGEVPGLEASLWRALEAVLEGSPNADAALDSALDVIEPGLSSVTETFVEAALAMRVNRPYAAFDLLQRLDSIPLDLGSYDPRWPMRGASLYLRGESSLAAGDTAAAVGFFQRFSSMWTADDPLTATFVRRARRLTESASP